MLISCFMTCTDDKNKSDPEINIQFNTLHLLFFTGYIYINVHIKYSQGEIILILS